jgi:2-dehydro-3-deoxyphosphogluconate aldolase / (4S)-4-hydroxy-2-oxoglutarate aldolase
MLRQHPLKKYKKALPRMNKTQQVRKALLEQKMLPLFYNESATVSSGIVQALFDAGIRVVEYTNRGEAALTNFVSLKNEVTERMPGLLLGIGTIKTAKQAQDYIAAGADFIVSPTINPEVGKMAQEAGLLWIPGCMTPTEIAIAEEADAKLVKIFPGNILGPGYINAIKDLFPNMSFMPTGGVEVEVQNLKAWFGAGVVAVGMGSKLITNDLLARNDLEGIKKATIQALELVNHAAL